MLRNFPLQNEGLVGKISLPNETMRGSGIQLLSLGQECASHRQPTPPLAMYPLDNGRTITIVLATNGYVILLELATMSLILSLPTRKSPLVITDHTVVLCASLGQRVAVRCFVEEEQSYLQVWAFDLQHPRWTVPKKELPSAGGVSPACTRLVTFHNERPRRSVRVWDVYNGGLMALIFVDNPHLPPPIDITFDSENRFCFYDSTHREPYVIETAPRINGDRTRSITRRAKERLDGRVSEKRYSLDGSHEWVVCGSQMICWVPPGYIRPDPGSHYWAGSSLVMIGQDGTLRKLTFFESSGRWRMQPTPGWQGHDSGRDNGLDWKGEKRYPTVHL